MAKFEYSLETQTKVAEFEVADALWKETWDEFENRHQAEMDAMEALREDRNSKLDAARHALRTEAEAADSEVKSTRQGVFLVQKKWSKFYIPEKLAAQLKACGRWDSALQNNIVKVTIDAAKYDVVNAYLTSEGIVKDFESCEDGQELTPAITGPKPISPLGAEKKDR